MTAMTTTMEAAAVVVVVEVVEAVGVVEAVAGALAVRREAQQGARQALEE